MTSKRLRRIPLGIYSMFRTAYFSAGAGICGERHSLYVYCMRSVADGEGFGGARQGNDLQMNAFQAVGISTAASDYRKGRDPLKVLYCIPLWAYDYV